MATHHADEKDLNVYLEQTDTISDDKSEAVNDARIAAFTPDEQKKIIWRIDRRLVLTLGFLYCVSLMDRTNTGIAVVAGMGVDLLLIKDRYSIIVLVFFIPYVLFQPPATVLLRKIGPRAFLPTITLFWGITMIGMAFVKSWTQLIPLRILLGIFEAGKSSPASHRLASPKQAQHTDPIQASSPAAHTFCHAGTPDTCFRSVTPSST
jgi:MFS family permease